MKITEYYNGEYLEREINETSDIESPNPETRVSELDVIKQQISVLEANMQAVIEAQPTVTRQRIAESLSTLNVTK